MDCIFIPCLFGCPTKIKQEGDGIGRICPRCNNAAVIQAKSRTWFEFCFVPLFPFSSKHVWLCGICQWEVPMQQGWEPALPGQNFRPGGGWGQQPPNGWYGPSPGMSPHAQPGFPGSQGPYQPNYGPPPTIPPRR